MEVGCVSGLERHEPEIFNARQNLAEKGEKVIQVSFAGSSVCRPVCVISQTELTD